MGHDTSSQNNSVLSRETISLATQFEMDEFLVSRLLDIRRTNAHSVEGLSRSKYASLKTSTSNIAALFTLASKPAHSCRPNVMFSSMHNGCDVRFTAIRPISSGDSIWTSYIINLYSTPAYLRQDKLLVTKNFHCLCERCSSFDDCRGFNCPKKTCSDVIFKHLNVAEGDWKCLACNNVIKECDFQMKLSMEAKLTEKYRALEQAMQRSELDSPVKLRDLIRDTELLLSSRHHLRVSALKLLIAFCTGQYDSMKEQGLSLKMQFMSPWSEVVSLTSFYREAAEASCQVVNIIECLASCRGSCGKACSLSLNHPAQADCVLDALLAIQKFVVIEEKEKASALASKYLGLLQATFGDASQIVKEVQAVALTKISVSKSSSDVRSCENPTCMDRNRSGLAADKQCSKCLSVWYCSRDCQVAHWPIHKRSSCKR